MASGDPVNVPLHRPSRPFLRLSLTRSGATLALWYYALWVFDTAVWYVTMRALTHVPYTPAVPGPLFQGSISHLLSVMVGFLENQATLLVLPVTVVALCVWPRSLTAARRVGWFVVAWLTLRFGLPLVSPPYELRTCGMKLAQWISLALPPAAVLWALYDRTVRRNPDYMILRLTRWLLAGLAVGSLLGALPLRLSSMLSSGPASVSWQDICTVILGQCLTVLYIYGAWTALKPPAKLAARRIRVIAYVGSAIVFIITALALGTFDNTISQGMPWMRMVYGIAVIGYMIKTVGIFAVVYWHWHPLAIGRATVLGDRRQAICQLCGYDLTGNVTGICPECGTRVSAPPRAAQRS